METTGIAADFRSRNYFHLGFQRCMGKKGAGTFLSHVRGRYICRFKKAGNTHTGTYVFKALKSFLKMYTEYEEKVYCNLNAAIFRHI